MEYDISYLIMRYNGLASDKNSYRDSLARDTDFPFIFTAYEYIYIKDNIVTVGDQNYDITITYYKNYLSDMIQRRISRMI